MAERSSPGVTELFVRDLLAKMVPNMTESRVRTVVDRMIRYTTISIETYHRRFWTFLNVLNIFCLNNRRRAEIHPKEVVMGDMTW